MLLDWVPGHFPTDAHGLGRFDGTALYEHADPRQGFHQDWSTLIYNFGRTEVANYLHANALFWLDRYHVDGLRVDAVASMLYLDYSRKAGEWVPNKFGGRENLEAVDFMRRMNELAYGEHPGVMTVAEESTAWPGVSRPTWAGGLGFGYKWNMGWMHDTLEYMGKDPAHRRWHHHQMTFGLLYAFSENFVLPLSHDEVVHGKGSILARMPGRHLAEVRQPARLLRLHVGPSRQEAAVHGPGVRARAPSGTTSRASTGICSTSAGTRACSCWSRTSTAPTASCRPCISATATAAASPGSTPTMPSSRCSPGCATASPARPSVLVVVNFTPVPREGYRIGLPAPGRWAERLNTDAALYGGSGMGNLGGVEAVAEPWHGQPCSATLTLPPLATLFFVAQG